MTITIPQVELLSAEAEIALARQIEVGLFAAEALSSGRYPCGATEVELRLLRAAGERAHHTFYIHNLPMVASLALQWAHRAALSADELFQEGCVGLGEAIQVWDHRRGIKFSTLAFPRVEWAISSAALVRCGQIEISRFHARQAMAAKRAWEKLEAEHGRGVGLTEVAAHLGREAGAVARSISLTTPDTLSPQLANRLGGNQIRLAEAGGPARKLADWLGELPEDEQIVLLGRHGFDGEVVTHAALGERLGVSASTVRRIEQRAINRIRRVASRQRIVA